MIYATRTTRSLITLACAVLLGLSLSAQAQGLKTNSGSFGSGWQVGGSNSETGSVSGSGGYGSGGYGSAGSGSSSDLAGAPASSYGGYSGSSGSTGATGGASSSYGGYSSTYGGTYGSASASSTSQPSSPGTDTPYTAPRSAGGGLRTQ